MALYDFLGGAVTLGFLVSSLFFLRYWRRTKDQLFMAFALAFALLGAGQALAALGNIPTEHKATIFLIRLGAFAIIIFAIARKNRAQS